jgi:hypothetical protein
LPVVLVLVVVLALDSPVTFDYDCEDDDDEDELRLPSTLPTIVCEAAKGILVRLPSRPSTLNFQPSTSSRPHRPIELPAIVGRAGNYGFLSR